MNTYTAAELIGAAKSYLEADSQRMCRRPAGIPRHEWRDNNPLENPTFPVRGEDGKEYVIALALNGTPYTCLVVSLDNDDDDPSFAGCIDLRAPGADQQLSKLQRS